MKKLILDLDTGIDDCLALAYALGSPEVEVIGVTGTFGNVQRDTGIQNSLSLLDLFGHHNIPVFAGASHALQRSTFTVQEASALIHGRNGLGDVQIPQSNRQPEPESACDFLIESAKEYGENLVIVATGPMTNLAQALEKDPGFHNRCQIVIMGGALTVPGNCNPVQEANISQDPEAADALFRSGAKVTMIGLDVTLQTLLTYEETAAWRRIGTPAGNYVADITDSYIRAYGTIAPYLGGCGLHDPLAVAIAIDPSLASFFETNLKVDVEEPFRGRTIGDEHRLNDPNKTVKVALEVNAELFLKEFMHRISTLLRSCAI
ncbi:MULTISPECIES: nucleoside hydrolase [Actinotignum]|uniref:Nucleoside hydrolase n=2 Tax=Bacillati TaxID=1783272 RepID=A0AAW9HIQ8_9ACTO|nr:MULTISPECIES: nucleoside hydrolase [Actinotignum]MDE1558570.1 nucleoside hydrolase [Actinotignum schaalii]MDE1663426.1 nucleoside hydrolase [Actinotignum schaalii]MDK6372734.1 nucleoside hydrolase [Actinotignum timonense]MDK6419626.1 nucleoside hydrolase [Actinotignum timonense]MDK6589461.1 nucleoside hydrolase [Actinotignum timonense]